MLTNDKIMEIVEGAFRPYRCGVEIWDYDEKLRFKVFDDKNNGIIERPRLILRELRDEGQLRQLLLSIRERVEEKGFELEPWNNSVADYL